MPNVNVREGAGRRQWRNAAKDAWQTIVDRRLWITLGGNDIAQRYRRSTIGQFWITLSMAVFLASIGSVYALLFRIELRQQLPHVVTYYTIWAFVSQTVGEGGSAFIEAERYLRQEALPKLAFIMRVVWRNFLSFLHNALLIPVTFLMFGVHIGVVALYAVMGFAFVAVNVVLASTIVAVLCTRFRDTRHIVQSVLQIAFFASPIMWRSESVPQEAHLLVDLNPVAAHLRLVGEPLLGRPPEVHLYLTCAITTLMLLVTAVPLFVRFRERVVYWL